MLAVLRLANALKPNARDQKHLGLNLETWLRPYTSPCRISDQGSPLYAFELHNARATILIPLNSTQSLLCLIVRLFQGKLYVGLYNHMLALV